MSIILLIRFYIIMHSINDMANTLCWIVGGAHCHSVRQKPLKHVSTGG